MNYTKLTPVGSYPENFVGYTAEEAYVLYAIFGIWQWFESIYSAVENADVTAQGPVGNIIKAINPIQNKQDSLGMFFQALTAMTPIISLPAMGAVSLVKLSGVLETALRQSPGVFHELVPTGTLDSQFDALTDIYEGLSLIKSTYQQNVSTALQMVQQNYTTFSLFTAHGAFIAARSALQAQTSNLTESLMTFVVAKALTDTNIVITLARDTNPQAFAANGSLGYPWLINCPSYDEYGICSEWWYDAEHNAAFALSDITNPSKSQHDIMESIFSNGWTTPSDLFLGALACADYMAVFGGNNTPTLDPVTFQPRCLSNTQVCVYDQSCAVNDQSCLYAAGEFFSSGSHLEA